MINIVHRVGIKAPLQKVYDALATTDGISGWWSQHTTGVSQVGKVIEIGFFSLEGTELGSMSMEVKALEFGKKVQWTFITGPAEWIGTDAVFELYQEGDFTIVLFGHKNWREEVEFTAHCSMKWGTFMLSLKDFVETGKGRPSPHDIKIDNWN